MFCEACGGQLSLRPCPNCDAVNDASAEVCYACKRELARDTVDHPSAGNEHVALDAVSDDRRRDYARIGLPGHDAVPVTNAVVTFEAAHAARARSATPFKGSILAAAGICLLVAIGVIFFVSTRGPFHSSVPANGALPTHSAAPAKPNPAERTSSAGAESAATSGPRETPRQPGTREESSTTNSSVEAKRGAAPQQKRVEAKRVLEPAEGRGRLEAGGAGGAVGMSAGNVAACDPGVIALGLCDAQGTEGTPATGSKAPPETARRSSKDEPRQQCTEAAAALGLCRQ